jgi:TonB family protein
MRLLVCAALAVVPGCLLAQSYQGVVIDAATQRPLAHHRVVLQRVVDSIYSVDSTRTDTLGRFMLGAASAGSYRLRFGPPGALATFGPIDSLGADSTIARQYAVPDWRRTGGRPYEAGEVEEPVRVIEQGGYDWLMPKYPQELRARRIDGDVLVEFVVDTTGKVLMPSIRVLRSSDVLFTESVRAHLRAARFTPAYLDAFPVPMKTRQAFTFRVSP